MPQNLGGHGTYATPISGFSFVSMREIAYMKLCTKFDVYSSTHFGDMFEDMFSFVRVT